MSTEYMTKELTVDCLRFGCNLILNYSASGGLIGASNKIEFSSIALSIKLSMEAGATRSSNAFTFTYGAELVSKFRSHFLCTDLIFYVVVFAFKDAAKCTFILHISDFNTQTCYFTARIYTY